MKIIRSFKYAIQGFLHCVRRERNFRFHLLAIVALAILAVVFELESYEIFALIFATAFVLVTEMINTAIERTVDAIRECSRENDTVKIDGLRKIAKDVAAGAVFVSAIFAAIVGVVVFLPRILEVLS